MRGHSCDICGGSGRRWTQRQERELLRCSGCGSAWVPQGVLNTAGGVSIYEDEEEALFEEHADYYYDASARDAAAAKMAWVTRFSPRGGRLLDVGANAGLFVAEAKHRFDAAGIEPSAAAVRMAKESRQSSVQVGSIYDAVDEFNGRFDAITMFDVIEHLEDPRRALDRCRQFLAPDGRLFLITPDSGSFIARMMGANWHYLNLDQHVSVFNAGNLSRLLADTGFTTISQRTFGRRYRFSYIERHLGSLGQHSALLRLAHIASLPLRLFPDRRVAINLHDVVGLVAERRPVDRHVT